MCVLEVWVDLVRCGAVRCGVDWFGLVQCGLDWFGLFWVGLSWLFGVMDFCHGESHIDFWGIA